MLKAHWSGYEIDSSEAAYEVKVKKPEELGTLVRELLTSGYFVRSYYLLFGEPMNRLRDFVKEHGDPKDKLAAKALEYLDKQIAKFDPESHRASRIGVRAIQAILNYVGAHGQELLDAEIFRLELTEDQKEYWEDVESDFEFEPGHWVTETNFYSESEIPFDGVVLCLGCSLVGLNKLEAGDRRKAKIAVRRTDIMIQEEEGRPQMGGRGLDEMDMFFSSMFGPREPWESYNRPQMLSLRVRLNPDATFIVTGRWMDDGQFSYGYYDYLLGRAARKAKAKIAMHMIY